MLKSKATPIFFGELPSAYFDRLFFTNVSELIFDKELYALLHFCGLEERAIGECASDFDRFQAYCNATQFMTGHPILKKVEYLLKTCFGIVQPCNLETCKAIWSNIADRLFESPITPFDFLQKASQGQALNPIMDVNSLYRMKDAISDVYPVLSINSLSDTDAKDWKSWEKEIDLAFERLQVLNGSSVRIKLQPFLQKNVPVRRRAHWNSEGKITDTSAYPR